MAKIDGIVSEFTKALRTNDKKTTGYDTTATVQRIDAENRTAWVHIPGGVDETPVRLTINAHAGDNVQVRVAGGHAWIVGNATAPPTDDTTANYAYYTAQTAQTEATGAKEVADTAWSHADSAKEAAEAAWAHADDAKVAADTAWDYADSAHEAADTAWNYADDAHDAATRANSSANDALTQLSIVEDVAGTLRWIQEHGSYVATTDTTVKPDKIYFQLSGGDYVPIASPDPTANPDEQGWYELDVSDSQAAYIMSHLAVTGAGLWVLPTNQFAAHPVVDSNGNQIIDADDNEVVDWSVDPQNADGYKVLLSNHGMTVYDGAGRAVATYGESITFASSRPQRIGGDNVYIEYFDSNNDGIPDSLNIVGASVTFSNGNTINSYATGTYVDQAIAAAQIISYNDAKEYTDAIAADIQDQLDGVVDTWYYDYTPTTSNLPARDWTTEALKREHEGDMFLDTSTGYSYRWLYQNSTWQWVLIPDTAATQALQVASQAQDTADHKRRVFVATPYPPYDEGDLWMQGSDGDILTCTTARTASASYMASDWSKLNKYTDDEAVESAISDATSGLATKGNAIKATVSCYYRKTTSGAPSKPTTSTTIGTSATTDNAWEYVMPQPKRGCYFFTCEEYIFADNNKAYSAVRSVDNATYTSKWCSATDNIYIDGGAIYANSVTADKLAANSVTADKLAANSVTADKLAANSVTADKLAANSVTADKLAANSVTADKIAAGTITFNELSSTVEDSIDAAQTTANTANKRATYHYGTCSTAIGTAAKVVTLSGFALYTGANIAVKFTNGNSATAPTLNVNSTGAKAVMINGLTSGMGGRMDFPAGTTATFTYNGSNWQFTGTDNLQNVLNWTASGGLHVRAASGSNSRVNITSSAVDIYDQNGKLGNRVNASGMTVYKGGTKTASFGDSISLGKDGNNYRLELSSNQMDYKYGSNSIFKVSTDSATNWTTATIDLPIGGIVSSSSDFYTSFESESTHIMLMDGDSTVDVSASGGIYYNGHSSTIGTILDKYLTATKAVANTTWVAALSLTIPAGVWVVTYGARFPSNATGYRNMNLYTASAQSKTDVNAVAVSGNVTQLRCSKVLSLASNTTYYLNVYQNSGSSLTLPTGAAGEGTFIQAVRIL